ncbi:MAG: hypothetical protein ACR2P5_06945 [Gammaproteobacteria bacterium]
MRLGDTNECFPAWDGVRQTCHSVGLDWNEEDGDDARCIRYEICPDDLPVLDPLAGSCSTDCPTDRPIVPDLVVNELNEQMRCACPDGMTIPDDGVGNTCVPASTLAECLAREPVDEVGFVLSERGNCVPASETFCTDEANLGWLPDENRCYIRSTAAECLAMPRVVESGETYGFIADSVENCVPATADLCAANDYGFFQTLFNPRSSPPTQAVRFCQPFLESQCTDGSDAAATGRIWDPSARICVESCPTVRPLVERERAGIVSGAPSCACPAGEIISTETGYCETEITMADCFALGDTDNPIEGYGFVLNAERNECEPLGGEADANHIACSRAGYSFQIVSGNASCTPPQPHFCGNPQIVDGRTLIFPPLYDAIADFCVDECPAGRGAAEGSNLCACPEGLSLTDGGRRCEATITLASCRIAGLALDAPDNTCKVPTAELCAAIGQVFAVINNAEQCTNPVNPEDCAGITPVWNPATEICTATCEGDEVAINGNRYCACPDDLVITQFRSCAPRVTDTAACLTENFNPPDRPIQRPRPYGVYIPAQNACVQATINNCAQAGYAFASNERGEKCVSASQITCNARAGFILDMTVSPNHCIPDSECLAPRTRSNTTCTGPTVESCLADEGKALHPLFARCVAPTAALCNDGGLQFNETDNACEAVANAAHCAEQGKMLNVLTDRCVEECPSPLMPLSTNPSLCMETLDSCHARGMAFVRTGPDAGTCKVPANLADCGGGAFLPRDLTIRPRRLINECGGFESNQSFRCGTNGAEWNAENLPIWDAVNHFCRDDCPGRPILNNVCLAATAESCGAGGGSWVDGRCLAVELHNREECFAQGFEYNATEGRCVGREPNIAHLCGRGSLYLVGLRFYNERTMRCVASCNSDEFEAKVNSGGRDVPSCQAKITLEACLEYDGEGELHASLGTVNEYRFLPNFTTNGCDFVTARGNNSRERRDSIRAKCNSFGLIADFGNRSNENTCISPIRVNFDMNLATTATHHPYTANEMCGRLFTNYGSDSPTDTNYYDDFRGLDFFDPLNGNCVAECPPGREPYYGGNRSRFCACPLGLPLGGRIDADGNRVFGDSNTRPPSINSSNWAVEIFNSRPARCTAFGGGNRDLEGNRINDYQVGGNNRPLRFTEAECRARGYEHIPDNGGKCVAAEATGVSCEREGFENVRIFDPVERRCVARCPANRPGHKSEDNNAPCNCNDGEVFSLATNACEAPVTALQCQTMPLRGTNPSVGMVLNGRRNECQQVRTDGERQCAAQGYGFQNTPQARRCTI